MKEGQDKNVLDRNYKGWAWLCGSFAILLILNLFLAGFGGGFSGPSMGGGYTESPGGFGSPSATQGERKSVSRI